MLLWLTVALANESPATPSALVSWKGDQAHLTVLTPLGEHLAPEPSGTVRVWVGDRELSVVAPGAWLEHGVELGEVRGSMVSAEVSVGVCRDVGGQCRMTSASLLGTVPVSRKGALQLSTKPDDVDNHPSPFRRDATADVDSALSAAAADGGVVLLDFTAVWCPPCNLLSAEVLHAPDAEEILSGVRVVAVDVDDPSSWALKDRYDVTGYPTVVAVDASGTEVDRLVGYEGRDDTLRWISDVEDGAVAPIVPATEPASTNPEDAAKVAVRLLARGDEDAAAPWIERADEAPDLVDTRVAHLLLEPTVADARWMLDNAPDRTDDWVMSAGALADVEGGPAALRDAVTLALRGADGIRAADLLYLAAEATPEADRPLAWATAAATLRAAFVGDDDRDRAHVTFLATLTANAGDVDGAVALLDDWAVRFPDEPTWDLSATGILREAARFDEALLRADAALEKSWGDLRYRAARAKAEALLGLGRIDDARAAAQAALDEQTAPAEGVDVRTHRYRAALEKIARGEGG